MIAALYDIHGNLPALEAVLKEVRQLSVDEIVIGGDVLPGPMPLETLACLQGLDVPVRFIYGNGEVAVLEQISGKEPASVPEQFRPIISWTAQQLDSKQCRFIASWPQTIRIQISGLGDVLFCHATPRNDNEVFTRLTPELHLLPIFEPLGVPVVVCGHTHMQFDRTVGSTRVLNAGSVGMPFGEPGAYWILLGPDVKFRRTSYNLQAAADRIRKTGYPQADDFAANGLLQPQTEAKMLELFSRAELK